MLVNNKPEERIRATTAVAVVVVVVAGFVGVLVGGGWIIKTMLEGVYWPTAVLGGALVALWCVARKMGY